MPIDCPIAIPRISGEEMAAIDYQVMAHAFAVHNELGRLADETVYHRNPMRRLNDSGIEATSEVPILLSYRDFCLQRTIDVVVLGQVIYELKTVSALLPKHESQLLEYMFLTNAAHGKLINFRTQRIQSRFVNTSFETADRSRFDFDGSGFSGDSAIRTVAHELISDWGTGLSASTYRRPMLHCLSTLGRPEQLLVMQSNGQSIGNQRFHLLSPMIALGVTTYPAFAPQNAVDFRKLVSASRLEALHWLNVTHHQVRLTTICR